MRRAPSASFHANPTLHRRNLQQTVRSAAPSASGCSFRRSALSGQRLTANNIPRKTAARGSVLVRSESDQVDIKDRAISSLPYLVPLFDGLRYGADFPCSLCLPIIACRRMSKLLTLLGCVIT